MSRWKFRARSCCSYPSWGFYHPEESLLALKIRIKRAVLLLFWSRTENRHQFPNVLISADTTWTVNPQNCCIFYLKCIILIFFLICMIFFWAFSCKWQNKTSAKQLDRSKDTFKAQSPFFTQKSLPHLCPRGDWVSNILVVSEQIKVQNSLLPHTPQRTSSAATLLGKKGQG